MRKKLRIMQRLKIQSEIKVNNIQTKKLIFKNNKILIVIVIKNMLENHKDKYNRINKTN